MDNTSSHKSLSLRKIIKDGINKMYFFSYKGDTTLDAFFFFLKEITCFLPYASLS